MKVLIFANGHLPRFPNPLPPHDILIAADGGARHLTKKGLIPDVVIGDMDSLSRDEVAGMDRAGASPIRFPNDKDETDLELALDFALESGATEITLYALFGGRWDMTFANLLLLAAPKYAGVRLHVVEDDTDMYILRGGETLTLQGAPVQTVSVLSLNGEATGVTYTGLTWPLVNATLSFGAPRGVSNTLSAETAKISLETGVLLCIHQKSDAN